MRLSINPGRLFWKLVMALFLSMVLAGVGVWAYVTLTGHPLPPPPDDMPRGPTPLIPIIAALFGSLAAGLVLAWYLSRPLRHLRWALDRVAHGRLDTRVRPFMRGRRDEIADLAHDFDRMAEQLQKAVESRRVLLHDVSHELRSPLARMQTAIGLLRQDPALTEPMLARIELESERLDHLIEELLTLHRLEAGAPATPRERVDLIELLHAIAEDAEFEARAKGNQVRIDAEGTYVTEVHGELIYRALENVIRNAVKYSPDGACVDVVARTGVDGLEVSVSDRGPGVPAEMLDPIFEPFVRLPHPAAGRGAGLGLAITRRAMTMHGAHAKAALRQGGGLEVTLSFPRAL